MIEEEEKTVWDFLVKKVKVKFLENVPEFVGVDLKDYGPFFKGDVAEIPFENAKIFLERGMAEKL